MAKAKPTQKPVLKNPARTLKPGQNEDSEILLKYGNYIFIGIIILAVLIFFKDGIFDGKVFATSDNLAYDSFKTFLDDAKKAGVFPLWVPYIFMGMPNFPIIGYPPRVYDFFYF